jgi:SAM-dependent methyltransferase
MDDSQGRQQVYFDRIAEEFDGHYATRKGLAERLVDRVFRQGMVQRWQFLTQELEWAGQSVVDIGCGPGRYMAAFVARGAVEVTGIDFASAMIAVARRNLEAVGALDTCTLIVGDFLTTDFRRTFDSVVAMGYFDYILGHTAVDDHFRRMWSLADRRVVASFPARRSFKTFPRWVWLSLRRCPVRFYSVGEVQALMARCGVARVRLIRMSGTILAVAEKA